jgi:hypothetical protein
MNELYDIPGFPMYKATVTGEIISYHYKEPKPLTQKPQKNARCRKQVRLSGRTFVTHRVILSAKLGRELEPWEQVRHIDGDRNNNHMDNLSVGCAVLNMIDDIENGTRQTSPEYIKQAISRLTQLLH